MALDQLNLKVPPAVAAHWRPWCRFHGLQAPRLQAAAIREASAGPLLSC